MHKNSIPEKIRILFIIDFIYVLSGTESQLVKLINNIDHNKYEVHLLSLRDTEWIKNNKSNLSCSIKTFNIIKLKNPLNLLYFFQIIKYIKRINPHIVMTFFPLSNILGVIASRIAKTPVIISSRRDYGLWLNWNTRMSLYPLRFANRMTNGIVVNSYSVKDLVCSAEKCDASKIHVIYNGLDPEKLTQVNNEHSALLKKNYGIPLSNKVIGLVANQRPMKRIHTFLKAAKQVLQVRSDIHFMLVGNGPVRKELEEYTVQLSIQDNVHFTGSQENIIPFLSLFDIGVNCSANEGLSNAIIEYMAYGIPCIVSRAGGNEELIENGINGYTFELNNDNELADIIIDLLKDTNTCVRFSNKSKEFVANRLSVTNMIKEYDHYFIQLLENARLKRVETLENINT